MIVWGGYPTFQHRREILRPNRDTNTYPDGNANSDPDSYSHTNSHAHGDPDSYSHTHSDAYCNPDSYSHTHSDTNRYANRNSKRYTEIYSDTATATDTTAPPVGRACAECQCLLIGNRRTEVAS